MHLIIGSSCEQPYKEDEIDPFYVRCAKCARDLEHLPYYHCPLGKIKEHKNGYDI